jgi:hypothetical protein
MKHSIRIRISRIIAPFPKPAVVAVAPIERPSAIDADATYNAVCDAGFVAHNRIAR